MGYPMDYKRVIARSSLGGDYNRHPAFSDEQMATLPPDLLRRCNQECVIGGDLRRLESDQRDAWHLAGYAHAAGITPEQAKTVLDLLFEGFPADTQRWMNDRHDIYWPGDER